MSSLCKKCPHFVRKIHILILVAIHPPTDNHTHPPTHTQTGTHPYHCPPPGQKTTRRLPACASSCAYLLLLQKHSRSIVSCLSSLLSSASSSTFSTSFQAVFLSFLPHLLPVHHFCLLSDCKLYSLA